MSASLQILNSHCRRSFIICLQFASLYAHNCLQVVEELSKVEGLSKILVAEHEAYKGFLPGVY